MTRVLIVDDKAENLDLLRALLQGHGCEVDEARHGAEALVKARQAPPDLIISDLLLPVMDGYTLLRHWKADERLKPIPFVVEVLYLNQLRPRTGTALGLRFPHARTNLPATLTVQCRRGVVEDVDYPGGS